MRAADRKIIFNNLIEELARVEDLARAERESLYRPNPRAIANRPASPLNASILARRAERIERIRELDARIVELKEDIDILLVV